MRVAAALAAVLAAAALSTGAAAQAPDDILTAVRALGLDSIRTDSAVTYFDPSDSTRARHVHELHESLAEFAHDDMRVTLTTRVAVLDEHGWAAVASSRYGSPTHFGPPANLMLVPAEPLPRQPADSLLAGEAADLALLAHEGGHLMNAMLVPAELRERPAAAGSAAGSAPAPEVRARRERLARMPPWYWEVAADYFAMAFLRERHPSPAHALTTHFAALRTAPGPSTPSLDDWEGHAAGPLGPGRPRARSSRQDAAWYRGLTGTMAWHVHDALEGAYIEFVRRMASGAVERTTGDLVWELDAVAPGVAEELDRRHVDWRWEGPARAR